MFHRSKEQKLLLRRNSDVTRNFNQEFGKYQITTDISLTSTISDEKYVILGFLLILFSGSIKTVFFSE